MTPPSTASARPAATDPTHAGTAGTDSAAAPVVRFRLTDSQWADRYTAIDLIAQRLHNDQCATGAGPDDGDETCSLTHWMAWTRPAVAALADAHVHTHHHTTGKRVVIEIDLPPDHSGGAVTGRRCA